MMQEKNSPSRVSLARIKQAFARPAVKDTCWSSYMRGLYDSTHGESYVQILKYFVPELISALLLYSLTYFYDAYLIGQLKSTSTYATAGVTNTMMHLITKMGEGVCVGTTILVGQYNGKKDFLRVGRVLSDAFWVTLLSGLGVGALLFIGADWIYSMYGVPVKMIALGAPYLRARAIAIAFMYVYLAFVGFLRGIKNTRIPMMIFIVGSIVFCIFDYLLVFGVYGFPALGLTGSAIASILQYGIMFICSAFFVLNNKDYRQYNFSLIKDVMAWHRVKHLLSLSWPVILDKATLAMSYLWLGALINPMGKYAIASYSVIKDLERLAILPAAAFAQVITFLVSNAYSVGDWNGIKTNVKKTVLLASIFVFTILAVFSCWPTIFVSIFDHKDKFTAFSASIIPLLSVLVFFDLLQLVLAGALRGAANVKMVLFTRLAVILLFFVPLSSYLASLDIANQTVKFFLIYGSLYVGNAVMSIIYIHRLRGDRWTTK